MRKPATFASPARPPVATQTTRLREDAALHGLPPQRTGKRGLPRQKGDQLPDLATLAVTAAVTRLWPPVFRARPLPCS
jgi:hypothetical protein